MKLEKFKEKKNKKKGIIIFTISCILLIAGVFLYQSFALFETRENFNFIEGNIENPGDLYFAYYIDDQITLDMPSKDSGYTLSSKSNCTNGVTISWDDERWSAIVNYSNYNITTNSRVKCNLYFEKVNMSQKNKEYLLTKTPEEQIIKDDGTEDHNVRYIGANPNNYIDIGERDEDGNKILWRIIGIMNNIKSSEEDTLGETKLKITRSKSIGNYMYHSRWSSWESSIVLSELNSYFDTMNETISNSFVQVLWDFTGVSAPPNNMNDMYDYEHAYKSASYVQHKTWLGKLGLLYLSDYGYATSGGLTTNREACLSNSLNDWDDFSDCFNADWLYNAENTLGYWAMAYQSTLDNYVFCVGPSGNTFAYYSNATSRAVFPVGYLNINKRITGEGTESSPFNLSA